MLIGLTLDFYQAMDLRPGSLESCDVLQRISASPSSLVARSFRARTFSIIANHSASVG